MISNTAASIPRAGIMFATTGDHDRPFPSLPDLEGEHGTPGAHEHLSYSFPIEDFPGWMLVSADPTRFSYYDDDHEAMDESNWSVIEGALGDYATEVNYGGPIITTENIQRSWRRNLDDAYEFRAFIVDRHLIVAPIVGLDEDDEHVQRVRALASLADQLMDYPFLDEDDYSRRDLEAWDEWAESGGLRSDTICAMNADEWDESLVEAIDENWSDVWPIAMEFLDEWRGFTGEHSPEFDEAIGRAIDAGKLNHVLQAINEAQHEDEDDEGERHSCAYPSGTHSSDLAEVWHGRPEPTYLAINEHEAPTSED